MLIFIMLVCIIGCSTTNTEEACEILSKRPSANSTRTESQPFFLRREMRSSFKQQLLL